MTTNIAEPDRRQKTIVCPTEQPSPARAWRRALELTASIDANPQRIFSTVLEERAEIAGELPALLSDGECMTYRELAERSNQYSRWALRQGLGRGDAICLIMPNRPEYVAIWLGISRTGCAVALVNTNLIGRSLAHSVNIVAPKHVIVAAELADRVAAADLGAPKLWVHGGGADGCRRIDRDIRQFSGEKLREAERPAVTIEDQALYIYTSGTTGLPKAANFSHARLMQWSHWFRGMLAADAGDRLYNCLPMYHGAGGVVGIAAMLASGGSVVVSEGFSASQFWNDVVRWDCTLFQYIGELCRYLLHAGEWGLPHRIRMCFGNGLKADVWDPFQSRFRIPRILEFYGATEGNVSLFNVEGKPGAIGRIPPYLAHRFPTTLIRHNVDTCEPVRNGRGFCIRCGPNESGEAIGRIFAETSTRGNRFEGYTSTEASAEKVFRDVFEPGDAWFRTGDLMRTDEQGYFYFVDRAGDTYRWKGENVASAEVEAVSCEFPGVTQATVYSVAIPGHDGRAGMAAVAADGDLDLAAFRAHLMERLPAYAQPLFLRLSGPLETTATFKFVKSKFMREGYDPAVTSDPIYFHHRESGRFTRLTGELYDSIQNGGVKL